MDIGLLRHDLGDRAFDLGWFPERLSPSEATDTRDSRLRGLEIRIDGIDHDDERYEEARSAIESILRQVFTSAGAFVFLVEHRPQAPSRIRSYKGVFPRSGQLSANCVQVEVAAGPGMSLIGGISEISTESAEEACRVMRDSLRSCALLISKECAPADLLAGAMECLDIKGSTLIDYMKLIPFAAGLGAAVVARGGDHETFESIRVFATEGVCAGIERAARSLQEPLI